MLGFGPPGSRPVAGTPVEVFAPRTPAGLLSFSASLQDVRVARDAVVASGLLSFGSTLEDVVLATSLPSVVLSLAATIEDVALRATRELPVDAVSFSAALQDTVLSEQHKLPAELLSLTASFEDVELILLGVLQANVLEIAYGLQDVAVYVTRFSYPEMMTLTSTIGDVTFTFNLDAGNGIYIKLDALKVTEIDLDALYTPNTTLRVN